MPYYMKLAEIIFACTFITKLNKYACVIKNIL